MKRRKVERVRVLADPMQEMLRAIRVAFRVQEQGRRMARVLDAAARLYPFISTVMPTPEEAQQFVVGGEIGESDVTRALRAVTIAIAMDGTIQARLNPDLIGRAHL